MIPLIHSSKGLAVNRTQGTSGVLACPNSWAQCWLHRCLHFVKIGHAVFMTGMLFCTFYFNKIFTLKFLLSTKMTSSATNSYELQFKIVLARLMSRECHSPMFRRANITGLRWDLVYGKKEVFQSYEGQNFLKTTD